jgi:hypothetical protein
MATVMKTVDNNFTHPHMEELKKINSVLSNYRLSFIEIKGIQIAEVCQIFERINQAGKPLSIFDIVVAKTFKPKTDSNSGFYLRELIDDFSKQGSSKFFGISNLDYLQTIAVLIRDNVAGNKVGNITDKYLNEITTEQILVVWNDAKQALLKTFDFFENHLHIKFPQLIPYRYLYFVFTAYFYNNPKPANEDYKFLKKYFWYTCFHNDDLLSNTTQLRSAIDFVKSNTTDTPAVFDRFLIDRNRLRSATYSSQGRISRAILSLYSNAQPKDWEHCEREVLSDNLFIELDKPNLHHVFPTNSQYVLTSQSDSKITSDSLMNIVYLTQLTNLDISNKNPIDYIKCYDKPEFEEILSSHYLSDDLLNWSRQDAIPDEALAKFIEKRVSLIIDDLKTKLDSISFQDIDTSANGSTTFAE